MICKKCANAAESNREDYDNDIENKGAYMHPTDCNCPCQHRHGPWEKMFSVERVK